MMFGDGFGHDSVCLGGPPKMTEQGRVMRAPVPDLGSALGKVPEAAGVP